MGRGFAGLGEGAPEAAAALGPQASLQVPWCAIIFDLFVSGKIRDNTLLLCACSSVVCDVMCLTQCIMHIPLRQQQDLAPSTEPLKSIFLKSRTEKFCWRRGSNETKK